MENDEFLQLVPSECIKANALERIKQVMGNSVVVLFIKGTPQKPYDGYQSRAVQLLDDLMVRYSSFDVMTDSDLREILKEHSRWNSFPQIFIRGKFIGGLNFLEDNIKNGRISNYIPLTEILLPMREKIFRLMKKGIYMIFMRGTPVYPACQQSRLMIEIFRKHYPWVIKHPKGDELLELEHFDLSRDDEIQL